MSIPEEEITKQLNHLLTSSDPGDSYAHLHVVAAPAAPATGEPDIDKRETSVYVLACDNTMDPREMYILAIAKAAVDHTERGFVVLFAAFKQELLSVDPFDDEARRLISTGGTLEDHPNVGELTAVYAAARDGRRWSATRWVTGPNAGDTEAFTTITGTPAPHEGFGISCRAIRKIVGIAG